MGSVVLIGAALVALPSGALAEESAEEGAPSEKQEPEPAPSEKAPAQGDADEAPTDSEEAPTEDDAEEAPAEDDAEAAPAEDDAEEAPSEKAPAKAAPKEKAPEKDDAPDEGEHAEEKEPPPEKGAKKAPPKRSRKSAKPGKGEGKREAATETEDEEVILKLRANRHIRIRARSVKLKSKSHARLLNIAKRYHEATKKKLLITGGDRTPHRQAELMYEMLAKGNNLLKLYTRVRLVRELTDIYETGKEKKRGARNIIRDMGKAIQKQVERGQYVSHHLAFTAADVRSRGLNDEQVNALRKAVSAEPGAKLVDERKSDAPHFHLSL